MATTRASNTEVKFEVKKFQSMRTMDGGGFSYDLWVNGVRAAFVCEEGNGGDLMIHWNDRKLEKTVDAHIHSLPPEPIPADAEDWEKELYPTGFRTIDLNDFLCKLADDYENAKRLKRLCKKQILFRLPEDGTTHYRTYKVPFTPETKARLLAKYPNATIINEQVGA